MKNLKAIIVVLLFMFWIFPPVATAVKLAPLNGGSSLQPMPSYVSPNVSGNVNSIGGNVSNQATIDIQTEQGQFVNPNAGQIVNSPNNTTPAAIFSWTDLIQPFIYFLAAVLLAAVVWIWVQRKEDKDSTKTDHK